MKDFDIVSRLREGYGSFSKSHRRLADYILKHPSEAAFLSINELSQQTGTSPATITRFVRRMEFQGYAGFQRALYENQQQWAPFGQLKTLLREENPPEQPGQDLLQWGIQSNIRLLEALYAPQVQESFRRALEILSQSSAIYIAGQRSSYTAAYYLAFMLQQMRCNVRLLSTSIGDLPSALSDVREEDCLTVVTYSRYTQASYDIVSHFHRLGCKIVAITDSPTSPIALKSTEILIAPNGENYSPVGAVALCNCLITSLGRQNAQQTLKRMEQQDRIALEQHIYL